MKKLRLSWTAIDLWQKQDYLGLLNFLQHKPLPTTTKMNVGDLYDRLNEQSIELKKQMIPEFFGIKVPNAQGNGKKFIEVNYTDEVDLVGEIDVYNEPIIYETKVSKYPASFWIQKKQTAIYGLLTKLANIPAKKIIVIRYSPLAKTTDWAMRWITSKLVLETEEYIKQIIPKILDFAKENKILDK